MCVLMFPAGLHPLQHNPYTEPLWRAAVAQYDRGMMPVEANIAGKLRNKFHQLEAQPHQVCVYICVCVCVCVCVLLSLCIYVHVYVFLL